LIIESNIRTQAIESQLLDLIQNVGENEKIRWKAASALENFKISNSDKLEKLLLHNDQTVRWLALKALGWLIEIPSAVDNFGKSLNNLI
jgi:HEAT repeat protein